MKELLPLTSRMLRDESAVASIMLAGTMLMTFATTGLAVDFGRALFAKIELQNALDAGALAGGAQYAFGATTMTTEALEYFGANWGAPFTSHLTGPNLQPIYTPYDGILKMQGQATATLPTTMLWAIGQTSMSIAVADIVDTPVNSTGGLEIAMVLDNTGSEAQGCKMYYLIAAAQGFVNQIYGVANPTTANVITVPGGCNPNWAFTIPTYNFNAALGPASPPSYTWTTLVPFVSEVAPVAPASTDMTNWIANGWVNSKHATEYPAVDPNWLGCVEARLYTMPGDGTSDAYGGEDAVSTTVAANNANWNGARMYGVEVHPSSAPFTRYFWPSDLDLNTGQAYNPKDANFPGGEPNAPYWPAFNAYTPVGGAGYEYITSPATFDGKTILATELPRKLAVDATCDNTAAVCLVKYPSVATGILTDEFNSTLTQPTNTIKNSGGSGWATNSGIPSNFTYVMGPNLGCPNPMTMFSTSYQTLMTNLAKMYPVVPGGTTTNIGLAWGFRALSPNWQGVWTAGGSGVAGNEGQTLPLPYGDTIVTNTNTRIAMQKYMIFLTDGNDEWFSGDGTSNYTAYRTLDHSPLLDQSPPWTNSSDVHGGTVPAAQSNLSNMATREQTAMNTMTNDAYAICDAMKADGIVLYTVLLEYNTSDISSSIATGYQDHCATGNNFWELTGSNVSELSTVFQQIATSVTALRIAQ